VVVQAPTPECREKRKKEKHSPSGIVFFLRILRLLSAGYSHTSERRWHWL
jgi:hypothetical protein